MACCHGHHLVEGGFLSQPLVYICVFVLSFSAIFGDLSAVCASQVAYQLFVPFAVLKIVVRIV